MASRSSRRSRSNSLSSASIVTVKRPGSLASSNTSARNSVVQGRALSPSHHADVRSTKRDHYPDDRDHKRRKSGGGDAVLTNIAGDSTHDGLNRWSHSTSSSVSSIGQGRKNRSNSGAIVAGQQYAHRPRHTAAVNHSPRAETLPRSIPQGNSPSSSPRSGQNGHSRRVNTSLTALPPLHMTSASHDASVNDSVSGSYLNPAQPSRSAHNNSDYLGTTGGASPDRTRDESHEAARERVERDKKVMLSKALQRANNAVVLDNAQDVDAALTAYGDACDLLHQVMARTTGAEDRHKLDVIRVTYNNRIQELQQIVQSRVLLIEDKDLPPPPDDTASEQTDAPSESETETLEPANVHVPPRQPAAGSATGMLPPFSFETEGFGSNNAQSHFGQSNFFEDGRLNGNLPGVIDSKPASRVILDSTAHHLQLPQHDRYTPAPLSPRRLPSPHSDLDVTEDTISNSMQYPHDAQSYEEERPESRASQSWLNTIDESNSSDSDSVHSKSSQTGGVRRKHIRGMSGGADPDFDVAFDAAVEAAYNEGFEPDLDAQHKRLTAYRDELHSQTTPIAGLNFSSVKLSQTSSPNVESETDDEAEERILDEMTQDFSPNFNFDLRSKSALPRQSDSSGYSRSTWQSSQASVDRTTAASSLSTVAEDGLSFHLGRSARPDEAPLPPPPSAPPTVALPQLPAPRTTSPAKSTTVRSRRLSGHLAKPLKIETAVQTDNRKRASTFHHPTSPPFVESEVRKPVQPRLEIQSNLPPALLSAASDPHGDRSTLSPPSLEVSSSPDDRPATAMGFRPSYEATPAEAREMRPQIFRKNKSSISLREHTGHTLLLASPELERSPMVITPMSSTFMSAAAKRNQNLLTSQRAFLPSFVKASLEGQQGHHLFDTSLSATSQGPLLPRSPPLNQPNGLEPCPDSFLLRPFWIMRTLSTTITHPRGGYITTRLFVPREVWHTRGVKLRLIEDKIASCDLLSAALGRLASVDTYDADAVMEELQSFENVMERVQATLTKKLGSDVGVHGAAASFRDAPASSHHTTVPLPPLPTSLAGGSSSIPAIPSLPHSDTAPSDRSTKGNSGKSYLSSWRKLRSKSSGAPLNHGHSFPGSNSGAGGAGKGGAEINQHTMITVPMTNFVPVERRGQKKDMRNAVFDGPNKEYMESLARLFDGVQILDQIARQVEDPGLKHSSPTHVGLELSIRHAAEFFGFYICRFVLADLGTLVDKFVKRGSEWVLA